MKEFFEAIRSGGEASVRQMLHENPALANATDDNGMPAYTIAVYHRKPEIAALLLERGANVDIFAAAMGGNEPRLRELLQEDPARASAFTHDGFTALHLACFFGNTSCARALIEAGAPVNARTTNPMKNLPIHAAAAGRKSDIVVALVEAGADVNARQHGGWTPLHSAAQNGDAAIVHVLIGAGADVRPQADNQQTPLDLAMLKGNQEMVDILEHYGAGQ